MKKQQKIKHSLSLKQLEKRGNKKRGSNSCKELKLREIGYLFQ